MAQVCWLQGRPREGLKRSRNRRSRRSCKAEGRWRLCLGQPVPDQTRSKQIRPYRVSGKPAIAMPGTPSDALPFPARAIAAKQKLRSFHDVVAKVRALVSDMLQNGNRRDSNSRKWRGVIGWAGAVGANPYLGTDATLRCALCYLGWEPSKGLELDRFFEQASDHAPADVPSLPSRSDHCLRFALVVHLVFIRVEPMQIRAHRMPASGTPLHLARGREFVRRRYMLIIEKG